MGKLISVILGFSVSFVILFYYNMTEAKKEDIKTSIIREDTKINVERFNNEFATASLKFAEDKKEVEALKQEQNRSKNEIVKIVEKRESAKKKYAEAEAKADQMFAEVEDAVNSFEETDFDF